MIRIDFSLAIGLYIILTVCLVLVLWLVFDKKRSSESFTSEENFFWQCSICTYVYVDSKHNTLSQCPRCGSYNKREE
ncbi:MAG: hypothetical protein KJ706_02095 [Candidatus Omnitrophica bacterium]|nr:hypothetical protein [Candidatus Omnitrophota bacterium]MBU4590285.1 hypothetical protein [Candidatus Omnitrophota bacterium]